MKLILFEVAIPSCERGAHHLLLVNRVLWNMDFARYVDLHDIVDSVQ